MSDLIFVHYAVVDNAEYQAVVHGRVRLLAHQEHAVAAALVLRRIGFSTWWALLCFVPIAALAGLWALALSGWPSARTDAG